MGYKFPEKHGLWKTNKKLYQCWQDMIQRCTNQNHRSYKNYGARGINVCDEWRNDFQKFFNDMGERQDGMSLDRINNDLGYSKENCRWATKTQQSRNTRLSNKEDAGVHYDKRDKAWIAQITINHKCKHVGYFKDKESAIKARKEAKLIYWTAHGIKS